MVVQPPLSAYLEARTTAASMNQDDGLTALGAGGRYEIEVDCD